MEELPGASGRRRHPGRDETSAGRELAQLHARQGLADVQQHRDGADRCAGTRPGRRRDQEVLPGEPRRTERARSCVRIVGGEHRPGTDERSRRVRYGTVGELPRFARAAHRAEPTGSAPRLGRLHRARREYARHQSLHDRRTDGGRSAGWLRWSYGSRWGNACRRRRSRCSRATAGSTGRHAVPRDIRRASGSRQRRSGDGRSVPGSRESREPVPESVREARRGRDREDRVRSEVHRASRAPVARGIWRRDVRHRISGSRDHRAADARHQRQPGQHDHRRDRRAGAKPYSGCGSRTSSSGRDRRVPSAGSRRRRHAARDVRRARRSDGSLRSSDASRRTGELANDRGARRGR